MADNNNYQNFELSPPFIDVALSREAQRQFFTYSREARRKFLFRSEPWAPPGPPWAPPQRSPQEEIKLIWAQATQRKKTEEDTCQSYASRIPTRTGKK